MMLILAGWFNFSRCVLLSVKLYNAEIIHPCPWGILYLSIIFLLHDCSVLRLYVFLVLLAQVEAHDQMNEAS